MCSVEEELDAVSQTEDLKYIDETGNYSYIVEILKDQVKVRFSIPESYPETAPLLEIVSQDMKEVDDSMKRMLLRPAGDCCNSALGKPMILTVMKNWNGFFKIAEEKCVKTTHKAVADKKLSKRERQARNRKAKLAPRFQHPPSLSGKQNKKNKNIENLGHGEQESGTKSEVIQTNVDAAAREQTEQKKKPSMKTAKDVIHRILWDQHLDSHEFVLGYRDRFDGIIETPVLELNWNDDIAATGPSDPLKIPEHRIEYFKWRTEIVWDKHHRMDHVFGSAGSDKDIRKFIDEFQEKQKEAAVQAPVVETQPHSDIDADPVPARVGGDPASMSPCDTEPSPPKQDGEAIDTAMKNLEISESGAAAEKSWAEQVASPDQQGEVGKMTFDASDSRQDDSDVENEDQGSDGRQAGRSKRSRDRRNGDPYSAQSSRQNSRHRSGQRHYHEDSGSSSHRDPKRQRRHDRGKGNKYREKRAII